MSHFAGFACTMRANWSNLMFRSTAIRDVKFNCFRRRTLHAHHLNDLIRCMQNWTFETGPSYSAALLWNILLTASERKDISAKGGYRRLRTFSAHNNE